MAVMKRVKRRAANRRELVLKSETHQVVGCAMEVLNIPGYGLLEKPDENDLVVELGLQEPLSYSSSATILHFG